MATPPQRQASSGSDGDQKFAVIDERKRKRMESNRESARRSRKRKQEHLDELIGQINELKNDNSLFMQKIEFATPKYVAVEHENNVLRAQIAELTDRLNSLNSVLHIAEDVIGFDMDIPEIPDTLMEPWQLPFPFEPITASTNMFQC